MKRLISIVFTGLLLIPTLTGAYGPSIHMRDAEMYITLCVQNGQSACPLPGPHHDPAYLRQYLWYLRLGSIWPDIARALLQGSITAVRSVDAGLVDPHNRHFNRYLLDRALAEYPHNPWKVAFATGCLLHNAGDLVAQDMLTQRFAVLAHTGETDILPGFYDTHPGGEVEMLLEGGLEFMIPAWRLYADMTAHFIADQNGRNDLEMVLAYYMQEYSSYFGIRCAKNTQDIKRMTMLRNEQLQGKSIEELMKELERMIGRVPWQIPGKNGPLYNLFSTTGISALATSGLTVDWNELLKIIRGPAGDQLFWERLYHYNGYHVLSPMILLTFEQGQGWFDEFPNWSANMMKSGVLLSLNHYLPGELAPEDGLFVADLQWIENDTGRPVQSISASNPPSGITLKATVYEVPGRACAEETISVRAREDSPAHTIVAADSGNVDMHLENFQNMPLDRFSNIRPVTISVAFDPSASIAAGANGFFAELAHGTNQNALPFFTTDWSVYTRISQIDFTRAAYTQQYSTYGHWPYSLKVDPITTTLSNGPENIAKESQIAP